MTSIHMSGNDEVTADDAERVIKNYTPSVQETTEETPDEAPDKSEISAGERKALDERQAPTFQAPFQDGEVRDRAPQFQPPDEWVNPIVKARRRREMMLPNRGAANDLEKRVNAISLLDGAPKRVQEATTAAREGIAELRAAYAAGSHPDNPRYARDQQAKDDVIVKVAEVTRVVVALEAVAQDEAVQEEWWGNLTGGIEDKRVAALNALREAEKAYAAFRGSIGSAQSLAVQQDRWDGAFHQSLVYDVDLNRVLSELKAAIGYIDPDSEASDDVTTGRYLVTDYEGDVPPHTMARLKRAAEAGGGGSFQRQLWLRAVSKSKDDHALQEALATQKFKDFMNSNPFQPRKDDIVGGIGG